jgi:hypothetical protein
VKLGQVFMNIELCHTMRLFRNSLSGHYPEWRRLEERLEHGAIRVGHLATQQSLWVRDLKTQQQFGAF